MRLFLKKALETGIVASGLSRIRLSALKERAVVLAYHNVVPDRDGLVGDTSLHLTLSSFRRQLDILERTHRIISLRELLRGDLQADEKVASVTFDDAYRGALTLGLPELQRRGLPSTVFVCPGLLGSEGFWWDRLADEASLGVAEPMREQALHQLQGRQEVILAWAGEEGILGGPSSDLYRAVEEVELMSIADSNPDVDWECHSWGHLNLSGVDPMVLESELERSGTWLAERGWGGIGALSYPYGLKPSVLPPLKGNAGREAGLLVVGGRFDPSTLREIPFSIPRMNIPRGIGPAGFEARLSGAWFR